MGDLIDGFPDSDADFFRLRKQFDLSTSGVIVTDTDDLSNASKLPSVKGLGQVVISNMTLHGIKPGPALGWNLLIVDESQQESVPEGLLRDPEETLLDTSYDVWINMLNTGSSKDLGETLLEYLEENGYVVVRGS